MIEVTKSIAIVAIRHAGNATCVCNACLAFRAAGMTRTLPGYGPRRPKAVKPPPDPRVSGLPAQDRESAVDLRALPPESLIRVLRGCIIGLRDVVEFDKMPRSSRDDIKVFTTRMTAVLDAMAERISPPATDGGSEI